MICCICISLLPLTALPCFWISYACQVCSFFPVFHSPHGEYGRVVQYSIPFFSSFSSNSVFLPLSEFMNSFPLSVVCLNFLHDKSQILFQALKKFWGLIGGFGRLTLIRNLPFLYTLVTYVLSHNTQRSIQDFYIK